jgi:acyl-CoA synthetase (AMP-forming)/AMP-acid ligase II
MPHDIVDVPPRTLLDLLLERTRRRAEVPAILTPGQAPVPYRQLVRHIDDAVAQLRALGVRPASRIATLLPDGPQAAVAVLSISAIASCLPLNPALRASELEAVLRRADPQALLVLAGTSSAATPVARTLAIPLLHLQPRAGSSGLFDVTGDLHAEPAEARFSQADDPMLVLPTSGTSAEPKLVTLRHRHVLASTLAIRSTLELTPYDRCLSVMPLFHIHGLSAIFASLAAGGSAVCPAGFSSVAFFDWLEELRPTWFTASPTIHRAILEAGRRHHHNLHASSLRFLRSASAPMPRDLARELEDFFGVPLLEAYGMTEASPQIASNRLPPQTRKPGSVGKAAGPEIVILPPESDAFTPLPHENVGEIAIRGDNVVVDGWLRTGDLGYLDADGDLFVTGRVGETINRGGEKIAPQEVEAALLAHSAVRDAVAFPVPHPTLGERVAAAVVLQPEGSVTATHLRQFLATRLAWFKMPQPILVVEGLPLGPTGKLQRKQLAAQLGLSSLVLESANAAAPIN